MSRQFTLTQTAVEGLSLPAATPQDPPAPFPAMVDNAWTRSQIATMSSTIGHLTDRLAPGQTVRYDVAELAVTLGLLPAGVPLLRHTLEALADAGTIQRDRWAPIDADRAYILGAGGSVPGMTLQQTNHFTDLALALGAMQPSDRLTRTAPGAYVVVRDPAVDVPRNLDFGEALAAMKAGFRLARDGWIKDGKWVVLRSGYPDGIEANENTARSFGVPTGTRVVVQPYFQMCVADGSVRTWNKGDQDLVATDWYVVTGSGNLTA